MSSSSFRSNSTRSLNPTPIWQLHPKFLICCWMLTLGLLVIFPMCSTCVYAIGALVAGILNILDWIICVLIIVLGLVVGCFAISNNERNSNSSQMNTDVGCGSLIAFGIWMCIVSTLCSHIWGFFDKAAVDTFETFSLFSANISQMASDIQIYYWGWVPGGLALGIASVSLVSLLTLLFFEWVAHFGNRTFLCHHADCGKRVRPIYSCPNCGTRIERLRPSSAGIFRVPCPSCQTYLSTLNLWGRGRYTKACPECGRNLNIRGIGKYPVKKIMLAGSHGCGKTSYLVRALTFGSGARVGGIQFADADQEKTMRNASSAMDRMVSCQSTPQCRIPAAVPILAPHGLSSSLCYLYDSAGDEFSDSPNRPSCSYCEDLDGILFFVDPFCETSFMKKNPLPTPRIPSDFRTAQEHPEITASRLCVMLERMLGCRSDVRFKYPICVVLTKADIYLSHLENRGILDVSRDAIADSNSERRIESPRKMTTSPDSPNEKVCLDLDTEILFKNSREFNQWTTAQSRLVRQFLLDCNMCNFVSILETRFQKVEYFVSSAYLASPKAKFCTFSSLKSLLRRIHSNFV
ncbi:MAG: hypothetical protein Q4D38_06240 [Planctomycetia bacterium]|nr:hypothetical protein [Planctomycetia bacterium]